MLGASTYNLQHAESGKCIGRSNGTAVLTSKCFGADVSFVPCITVAAHLANLAGYCNSTCGCGYQFGDLNSRPVALRHVASGEFLALTDSLFASSGAAFNIVVDGSNLSPFKASSRAELCAGEEYQLQAAKTGKWLGAELAKLKAQPPPGD